MDMSKKINVTTLHDIVGEGDEIIVLDIIPDCGNIVNVESTQNQTEITIVEDDSEYTDFILSLHKCTHLV